MISPCLSGGAQADMPVGVAHVQLCGFSLPLTCAAVVGGFSFGILILTQICFAGIKHDGKSESVI